LQGEYRQVIRPARGAAAWPVYKKVTAAVLLGLLAAAAAWLVRRRAARTTGV